MTPSRPLTHDLFKGFADKFLINVKEIIVYNLVEGIFFSKIVCEKDGVEQEIDARTSDAIAIAVRFGCPVFTYEFILSSAGIILEDEEEGDNDLEDDDISLDELTGETVPAVGETVDLSSLSVKDLEQRLNDAIADEDYEKASLIRDEINKKKSN